MREYIIRRLLLVPVTLLLVSFLVFALARMIPGDIVDCDLIVCQRFRDPELTTAMIDRLRVGGYAIITVLSTVGAPRPGDFHAPPGALRDEFAADERCEIVHHDEGDGVAHIVVRRC